MPGSDRLFLQLDGGVAGPYAPQQVRELAEGTLVTPATPAALTREGPWRPVGELPQAAEIFPPKTARGFKPTVFENLNSGAPVAPVAPAAEKTESVLALKSPAPAASPPSGAAPPAVDVPPNDVREMVDEVAAIEARIAPPLPPPKPWRPSGRLVLVAALALLGNGVVCTIPFFYDATDVFSVVILRGWFVIYNGGLVVVYLRLPKD